MSLQISETLHPHLKIFNSENNLDKSLTEDDIAPLPNYSGFNMFIVGASGSGKTTSLYSLMTKPKQKGKRVSYKKLFDKIYIVSPTMANTSIKKDPFNKIPKDQVHRQLTIEVLNKLENEIQSNREEKYNSVIILDDVGSQIKKSAAVEKKLTQMIQNRRHDYCSYFTLLQKFKDAPTGIRNNISHLLFYKPKNEMEKEAIGGELFPFKKKKFDDLFNYVFENDDKFSFMFIDMSLKETNKFIFYNKFNKLDIYDEEKEIMN